MAKNDREWTVVQLLYRDPRPVSPEHPAGWTSRTEYWVVLTGLKSEARAIVEAWLAREGRAAHGDPHVVCYYPRNYVDQQRDLVARGRVLRR